MLFTAVFLGFVHKTEDVNLRKPLSSFPTRIDGWVGQVERFDDEIYKVLGVDDSFLANYQTSDGQQVNLYIGFYQSQRQGEIIHSPKNCMPGAGWNIIDASIVTLIPRDQTNPASIKVNQFVMQNGTQQSVALYWFHSRGRIITSEYLQKVYLVLDSIMRHRTDGSFIRLMSPFSEDGVEETRQRLIKFAESIFPTLQEFIPS
jgi:EpsI family protein